MHVHLWHPLVWRPWICCILILILSTICYYCKFSHIEDFIMKQNKVSNKKIFVLVKNLNRIVGIEKTIYILNFKFWCIFFSILETWCSFMWFSKIFEFAHWLGIICQVLRRSRWTEGISEPVRFARKIIVFLWKFTWNASKKCQNLFGWCLS